MKKVALVAVFTLCALAASTFVLPAPTAKAGYAYCVCEEFCADRHGDCIMDCAAFGPPAPYCLSQCSNQWTNCVGHCGTWSEC